MLSDSDLLQTEQTFFRALLHADAALLEVVLAEDFVLIDLSGSQTPKRDLLAAVRSGQLRFTRIEPFEFHFRLYGSTAVVTGRTEIEGAAGADTFRLPSRYTHVYVRDAESSNWRLVSAQGTPIAGFSAG